MNFDFEASRHLLRCPKSLSPLVRDGDTLVSCDPDCRLRYPIIDGFPVLLIDEATAMEQVRWAELMRQHDRDPVTGEPAGTTPRKG